MARSAARRTLRRWVPQQHGAWAMLVVPALAGAVLGGWQGWHAALFLAWLFAYGAAYHLQEYVRLRRIARNPRAPRRHLAPLLGFGAAFAGPAVALAIARPWTLVAAAALLPFFAVNVAYAYRNDERAVLNDLAAVVPACAMLLVSYRLGAGALDRDAWRPAAACLLYFAGAVFYVKTMIRERGSRAYRVASAAYHALAVGAAAVVQPWLAVPFAWYLARALVLPGRSVKIGVVGAIEVLNSAALFVAIVLLF